MDEKTEERQRGIANDGEKKSNLKLPEGIHITTTGRDI